MRQVDVVVHPGTYQYFSACERDFPGLLEHLKSDFRIYMRTDGEMLPRRFGRDVPYTQPPKAITAQLMHIHICLPPREFSRNIPQFDRRCRLGEPERDAALVYVQGLMNEDIYCLLALLYPEAHGKARDRNIMNYLARLAEEFREQN